MAIEDVVIAYKADISDIQRNVQTISRVNKQLAQQIGIDFSKGFSVVNNELKKLQVQKAFKGVSIDTGQIIKGTGTVSTFEKTLQSTDGQIVKVSETFGQMGDKVALVSTSLISASNAQTQLIGKSSQLTTNFQNSEQLKGFGTVTNIVGSELNKTKDNARQVNTVIQDSNGQFLKLTETSKLSADGIQSVSRSVQKISNPFKDLTGQSSQLATNFNNLSNVNATFNRELANFGGVSKFLKQLMENL